MNKKKKLIIVGLTLTMGLSGCGANIKDTGNVGDGTNIKDNGNFSDGTNIKDNSNFGGGTKNAQNEVEIISEGEAKNIALSDAQIKNEDVTNIRVRLSMDDGVQEYEVEFYSGSQEYDYEIDAVTGKITSKDMEIDNDFGRYATENVAVSIEEAKQIALDKVAGATEQDIHIVLDSDDGRLLYEGTIFYAQMEYEFEIDAQSGRIWSWEEESVWD